MKLKWLWVAVIFFICQAQSTLANEDEWEPEGLTETTATQPEPQPVAESETPAKPSENSEPSERVFDLSGSIMPFAGYTGYQSYGWDGLRNRYTLGLAFDTAIVEPLYAEVEGSFGENEVRVGYFNYTSYQYALAGSLKLAPTFGIFTPYAAAGMQFTYYYHLTRFSFSSQNKWVGAAKLTGGLSVDITPGFSVGVRGAILLPVLGKNTEYRYFYGSGYFSQPEDAVDAVSWQLLGTVSFTF